MTDAVVLAFFESGSESEAVESVGLGLFRPALARFSGAEAIICAGVVVLCVALVTGIREEEEFVRVDEAEGTFGGMIGASDKGETVAMDTSGGCFPLETLGIALFVEADCIGYRE